MAVFIYKSTVKVEEENALLRFVELKAAINFANWKPL